MSTESDTMRLAVQELARLIESRLGVWFHGGNTDRLAQGLWRLGIRDAHGVWAWHAALCPLTTEQPAWQRMIAEISVGETYFFRHPEDFLALSRRVIPALIQAGDAPLRVWSAACATGEEAYSLAMCLRTLLPLGRIEVLGSDLNEEAIRFAQRGVYGSRSFRGALPNLEALLPMAGDGQRRVPEDLARRVTFAVHNLIEPGLPVGTGTAPCQVIFCRNVLIYFGADGAKKALTHLAQCLCPDGLLFVSPLDLAHQVPGLVPVEVDGLWLLKKTSAQAVTAKATRAVRDRPRTPAVQPTQVSQGDEVRAARLLADRGDLQTAAKMAHAVVQSQRTPHALHLLALIAGEQGQPEKMRRLLEECVAQAPDYVQGQLSLGLWALRALDKPLAIEHLQRVVSLVAPRPEDEMLEGPEPMRVSLARRLAEHGLHNLRQTERPASPSEPGLAIRRGEGEAQ